jgi:hypothetical protein
MPPAQRQRLAAIGFPGNLTAHPAMRPKRTGRYLNLENTEEAWRDKYIQLTEFRNRFGHCYVPHPWPELPGLGMWVQAQRERREDGILDAEHIARLCEKSRLKTGLKVAVLNYFVFAEYLSMETESSNLVICGELPVL